MRSIHEGLCGMEEGMSNPTRTASLGALQTLTDLSRQGFFMFFLDEVQRPL